MSCRTLCTDSLCAWSILVLFLVRTCPFYYSIDFLSPNCLSNSELKSLITRSSVYKSHLTPQHPLHTTFATVACSNLWLCRSRMEHSAHLGPLNLCLRGQVLTREILPIGTHNSSIFADPRVDHTDAYCGWDSVLCSILAQSPSFLPNVERHRVTIPRVRIWVYLALSNWQQLEKKSLTPLYGCGSLGFHIRGTYFRW